MRVEGASSRRIASWLVSVAILICSTGAACTAPTDEEPFDQSQDELRRCSNAKASKLASVASRMEGKRSKGLCYRYVKSHLKSAGISVADIERKGYGASAYMFSTWARKNPRGLAQMGLAKTSLDLDELPRGAVLVWPRGMCGYNRSHGHIEIVVDDRSSRACSDFCGRIRKGCGTPEVYVPASCASTAPREADDAEETDSSVEAPADDVTSEQPASTDDASSLEGGDCYSPTLDAEVEPGGCVQSRSDGVWYQCQEGLWYRGVAGGAGRFGACSSTHPLD